jgi:hypothetical protein
VYHEALQAFHEIRDLDAEGIGYCSHGPQGDVALTTLNCSDVGPVNP